MHEREALIIHALSSNNCLAHVALETIAGRVAYEKFMMIHKPFSKRVFLFFYFFLIEESLHAAFIFKSGPATHLSHVACSLSVSVALNHRRSPAAAAADGVGLT